MDDRLATLERKVSDLSSAVTALERRLAELESTPTAPAATVAETAPAPGAPDLLVESSTDVTPVYVLSLVGRTCFILGGAYVLRALTDAGTLPRAGGTALGILYAIAWLVPIYRLDASASRQRLTAASYGVAMALIAFPILWEATVRENVKLLSPGAAALAMGGVTTVVAPGRVAAPDPGPGVDRQRGRPRGHAALPHRPRPRPVVRVLPGVPRRRRAVDGLHARLDLAALADRVRGGSLPAGDGRGGHRRLAARGRRRGHGAAARDVRGLPDQHCRAHAVAIARRDSVRGGADRGAARRRVRRSRLRHARDGGRRDGAGHRESRLRDRQLRRRVRVRRSKRGALEELRLLQLARDRVRPGRRRADRRGRRAGDGMVWPRVGGRATRLPVLRGRGRCPLRGLPRGRRHRLGSVCVHLGRLHGLGRTRVGRDVAAGVDRPGVGRGVRSHPGDRRAPVPRPARAHPADRRRCDAAGWRGCVGHRLHAPDGIWRPGPVGRRGAGGGHPNGGSRRGGACCWRGREGAAYSPRAAG